MNGIGGIERVRAWERGGQTGTAFWEFAAPVDGYQPLMIPDASLRFGRSPGLPCEEINSWSRG